MKRSGTLVASVVAFASSVAFTSSYEHHDPRFTREVIFFLSKKSAILPLLISCLSFQNPENFLSFAIAFRFRLITALYIALFIFLDLNLK